MGCESSSYLIHKNKQYARLYPEETYCIFFELKLNLWKVLDYYFELFREQN
jgi:hypothetical protein